MGNILEDIMLCFAGGLVLIASGFNPLPLMGIILMYAICHMDDDVEGAI